MAASRTRRFLPIPLLLAVAFAVYQYFGAEKVTNPETGRAARVAMSTGQEKALGLASYREVLSQSEVVARGPERDLVVGVAQRLIPVVGDVAGDFDWQVSVVRSEQANAFCLPGGKIVVYTGILRHTQNEAALAAVMGHEMAHAIARHGSQRMLRTSVAQTIMAGAQFSFSDMDYPQRQMVLAALGAGAQFGILLPFSRDHETEADAMGLLYMARAGYDPREAISFWQRMEQAGGEQPPEFMSTHPSHASRVARLNELMPKALAEYGKRGASVERSR
ncbi:MAG: M48 family metallopeptidase [Opitutaceae bacterium]